MIKKINIYHVFLKNFQIIVFSLFNNNTFKNIIKTQKLGISEALYNLAQTLFSQNMYETSLALAKPLFVSDEENHLAKC